MAGNSGVCRSRRAPLRGQSQPANDVRRVDPRLVVHVLEPQTETLL